MIIQLDEPSLPAVLGGGIATASGLGRHRPVDIPEVSTAYTRLVERLGDTPVIVHCCAPGYADRAAGRRRRHRRSPSIWACSARPTGTHSAPPWNRATGCWPAPCRRAIPRPPADTADQVAAAVLGPIRRLELPPEISTHTVVTPACGLAGFSRTAAIAALRTIRTAAGIVGEGLYD